MQINADDGTTFVLRGEHYLLKIEKRSIKGIWCEKKLWDFKYKFSNHMLGVCKKSSRNSSVF